MITFQPEGIAYINKEGESILESARNAGVFCENVCGGKGTCGKCKVKVEIGEFNPVTKEETLHFTKEELAEGYRLACCLYPKFWFKSCEILVEIEKKQQNIRLETEGEGIEFFREKSIEFGWKKNKGKLEGNKYGMAVDIGTTNIEALFWNLENGECIARILQSNPQQKYGADVVSRIGYAIEHKSHFEELSKLLRDLISYMANLFMEDIRLNGKTGGLEKVIIAGNAVMMHFYAGEEVSCLAKAPYQSIYKEARCMKGEELGLKGADIFLLPNIEGFVGADTVGVMLCLNSMKESSNILVIDIGTNGELVLYVNGECYVSSTSAGPAFEGANMVYGMRAEVGAITGFHEDSLQVIGEGKPKGICGSGLIEIVAKLLEIGVVEESGYLLTRQEAKEKGLPEHVIASLQESEYGAAFELYKDTQSKVLLTQKDIRELQLAKGAIVAGVNTLLTKCNLKPDDVDKCYLAGAFGTYLNGECAKRIGLLPDFSSEKIIPIGNAALLGACQALLNENEFYLAKKIAAEAKHISLSEEERFREEFIKGMGFSS